MPTTLTRLYPPDALAQPLQGLCLEHRLIEQATAGQPYIYSSFIASLNGAIAVDDGAGHWTHPPTLTDPRDLRLLCELMAQADCLITSGGYLRDLQRGSLGNLLQLPSTPQCQDLHDYRARHHNTPAPSLLIVSRSLDFQLPASVTEHQQTVRILAAGGAPEEKVAEWRAQGFDVTRAQRGDLVDGTTVVESLNALGARTAYLFCGPQLNNILLQDGHIRRVYFTWLHRLQGGHPTLTAGSFLPADQAIAMTIRELFQADAEGDLPGLWLGCFEP